MPSQSYHVSQKWQAVQNKLHVLFCRKWGVICGRQKECGGKPGRTKNSPPVREITPVGIDVAFGCADVRGVRWTFTGWFGMMGEQKGGGADDVRGKADAPAQAGRAQSGGAGRRIGRIPAGGFALGTGDRAA